MQKSAWTDTRSRDRSAAGDYGGVWSEQGSSSVQQPVGQEQASGSWIHAASDLAGCAEPLPERDRAVIEEME